MRKIYTGIRLEPEILETIKKVAPEGNVSMWVRVLIDKELNRLEKETERQINKEYGCATYKRNCDKCNMYYICDRIPLSNKTL